MCWVCDEGCRLYACSTIMRSVCVLGVLMRDAVCKRVVP